MNVFLAGATGAVGARLLPLLVRAGHVVTGTTRRPERAESIRAAGGTPVVVDALDADAVRKAVERVRPEAIVHQLTAIPAAINIRRFDQEFAATNRLRSQGTDYLLAAARAVGCHRFVAQSFGGWPYARTGGWVKTETDRLIEDPGPAMRRSLEAIRHVEAAVQGERDLEGFVLRYGFFYGPGTSIGPGGATIEDVRRRRIPVVGKGTGYWSFVHIDDAASATLAAVEATSPGVYNVADDEPAPVSEWLPYLAQSIGAKPPRRIPEWLGRLAIGTHGVAMMTESRGISNQKAKSLLGWRPARRSWREGFRHILEA
jgi:nucleoside-diphosphate-sugar epimerase